MVSSAVECIPGTLRHGVFCCRMLSPVGRNAQSSLVGLTMLHKLKIWRCARAAVSYNMWNSFFCILDLLFIRCTFYILDLLSHAEIDMSR